MKPAEGKALNTDECGESQVKSSGLIRALSVEKLFPSGVVAFESRGEATTETLFSSERECVAGAVDRRVREFAAGRMCAHAALRELDIETAPLLRNQDRTPKWPGGVVGCISHTDNYCVAVVGSDTEFAGIGVDAECVEDITPDIWHLILRPDELLHVAKLVAIEGGRRASLAFSAKEAFYKCQYALARTWLGFGDVAVNIVGVDEVEVQVAVEGNPRCSAWKPLVGRFRFHDAVVVTGFSIEASQPFAVRCQHVRHNGTI
jgi:4'-phosphopantetheinyl transferase EntD